MHFFKKEKLKSLFFVSIFLYLLSFPLCSNAQVDSLKNYKRECAACENLVQKGKIDKAINCYTALSKQSNSNQHLLRLADLAYNQNQKDNAVKFAKQAIRQNAESSYSSLMYLCNKMNSRGDDNLAIKIMDELEKTAINSEKQQKIIESKKKLILKSYADRTPVIGVDLNNLGPNINTNENEYLPSTSLDESLLLFTRNVGGNEDFFISIKDSSKRWTLAKNLGYPPNTNLPDGGAQLSGDGHYLFYTRCDMRSPDGIVGGGCDIAFCYEENGVWSSPQYFGFTINTTGYEGQPSLSIDNKDLYFVSDRAGGYGGKDIWVSHFKNNYWTEPENLGAPINTEKDETSPFIHADNETLYFSSDGHACIGMTDLFVTRKNQNNSWRKPINLGAPINTEKHDGSISVSADGKTGYCASDRADGLGGLDLYTFNLHPAIQPIPIVCLKGFIIDKFTKAKLKNTVIQFFPIQKPENITSQKSNAGDASYDQALQKGKIYRLHIESDGYRPFNKTINLSSDTIGDILHQPIRMRQPGLIDTLFKTSIMFDGNSLQLESGSIPKLDYVLKKWNAWNEDSARVTIFLKGAYYCCDSLSDTLYHNRLKKCQNQLEHLAAIFKKRKISCDWVMQDMDLVIYNDDKDLFNEVELIVIENY